jgi:hypothetical protein
MYDLWPHNICLGYRDGNIVKCWDCPYALCSYVTHGQLNVYNSKYSIRPPASAMTLCRITSWPLAAAVADEHMEKELEGLLDGRTTPLLLSAQRDLFAIYRSILGSSRIPGSRQSAVGRVH